MSICASCGRRVDSTQSSSSVCPSCTWRAALRIRTAVDDGPGDRHVALAAQLHELAMIVGERLETTSLEVLEAVARGNLRVYENEVTRLANRFVERLEATWKSA